MYGSATIYAGIMLNATTSIQIVTADLNRAKARIASDVQVKRETKYYLDNIKSVKTSKNFVNNYRLFSYAMKAYGLSDMTYAKTMMQRVMDGGVTNAKSMANHLSDPRFKAFAKAFDFGDKGAGVTASDAANSATTKSYIEQALEDDVGEQNEGARIALYFMRNAPNITSGYQVLGDKALFRFVQTAFDIPATSSNTLDRVSKLIESKIHIGDLKDSDKVKTMVKRFATLWDLQNSSTQSTSGLQLGQSATFGGGVSLPAIQSRYSQF